MYDVQGQPLNRCIGHGELTEGVVMEMVFETCKLLISPLVPPFLCSTRGVVFLPLVL